MSTEMQYDSSFVRLEAVFGYGLHYPEALHGETVSLTTAQHFTAASVLRGVAAAMQADRAAVEAEGGSFDDDNWLPSDTVAEEISEAHGAHRRYLRGVAGLRRYVQEIGDRTRTFDEEPFDHQVEALQSASRHLGSITPFAGLAGSAYGELSGGGGKSRIIAMLVEGFKLEESPREPNRICVITSDNAVLNEVIGADGKSGLGKYAPGVRCGKVNKDSKQWNEEVVGVTRDMVRRAIEADPQALDAFDLIIIDEVHTAMAQQTRAALRQVKKAVIGLTGTASSRGRSLGDFMPTRLVYRGARELIMADKISPVQTWVYKTEHNLRYRQGDDDISPAELIRLSLLKDRQTVIIAAASAFLRDARNGAISCSTIAEAEAMAEIFDGMTLTMFDGRTRHIRAAPVHGKTKNNHGTFRALENDTIQLITLANIVTGWNVPRLSFVCNGRPVFAPAFAGQRNARLYRKFYDADGRLVTAQIFDVVDVLRLGRRLVGESARRLPRQILGGELLGETHYEPGAVIASAATNGKRRDFALSMFPEALQWPIVMAQGQPLYRLSLFGAGIKRDEAPPGYISLSDAASGMGVRPTRLGVALVVAGARTHDGQFIDEANLAKVERYFVDRQEPIISSSLY